MARGNHRRPWCDRYHVRALYARCLPDMTTVNRRTINTLAIDEGQEARAVAEAAIPALSRRGRNKRPLVLMGAAIWDANNHRVIWGACPKQEPIDAKEPPT